eukprot:m.609231 g.609231  ORF g.609231 m.609231 type:complete len:1003 (-) comp58128_c0_seq3:234-3242(-)
MSEASRAGTGTHAHRPSRGQKLRSMSESPSRARRPSIFTLGAAQATEVDLLFSQLSQDLNAFQHSESVAAHHAEGFRSKSSGSTVGRRASSITSTLREALIARRTHGSSDLGASQPTDSDRPSQRIHQQRRKRSSSDMTSMSSARDSLIAQGLAPFEWQTNADALVQRERPDTISDPPLLPPTRETSAITSVPISADVNAMEARVLSGSQASLSLSARFHQLSSDSSSQSLNTAEFLPQLSVDSLTSKSSQPHASKPHTDPPSNVQCVSPTLILSDYHSSDSMTDTYMELAAELPSSRTTDATPAASIMSSSSAGNPLPLVSASLQPRGDAAESPTRKRSLGTEAMTTSSPLSRESSSHSQLKMQNQRSPSPLRNQGPFKRATSLSPSEIPGIGRRASSNTIISAEVSGTSKQITIECPEKEELGISIEKDARYAPGFVITRVAEHSLAAYTAQVHVGDQLLSINGINLRRMSLEDVRRLILEAGETPMINLGLWIPMTNVIHDEIVVTKLTTVEVPKGSGSYGMQIAGDFDSESPLGRGVFIKEIYPTGPAALTRRLRRRDRILEVNGVDLRNSSHATAVAALMAVRGTAFLTIERTHRRSEDAAHSTTMEQLQTLFADTCATQTNLPSISEASALTRLGSGTPPPSPPISQKASASSSPADKSPSMNALRKSDRAGRSPSSQIDRFKHQYDRSSSTPTSVSTTGLKLDPLVALQLTPADKSATLPNPRLAMSPKLETANFEVVPDTYEQEKYLTRRFGWLIKKAEKSAPNGTDIWERRWFELQDTILKYYRDAPAPGTTALGYLNFSKTTTLEVLSATEWTLTSSGQIYRLRADIPAVAREWIRVMDNVCTLSKLATPLQSPSQSPSQSPMMSKRASSVQGSPGRVGVASRHPSKVDSQLQASIDAISPEPEVDPTEAPLSPPLLTLVDQNLSHAPPSLRASAAPGGIQERGPSPSRRTHLLHLLHQQQSQQQKEQHESLSPDDQKFLAQPRRPAAKDSF